MDAVRDVELLVELVVVGLADDAVADVVLAAVTTAVAAVVGHVVAPAGAVDVVVVAAVE